MTFSCFRPIYYLGCKAEFSEPIKAAIEHVDPQRGRLADLFAGTGAVAAALATTREVATVDIQEYSRVLCSAVLSPSFLSAVDIQNILVEIQGQESFQRLRWCFEPLISYENRALQSAQEGDSEALIELIESKPIAARLSADAVGDSDLDVAYNKVISRLEHSGLVESPDATVSRLFGGAYFSFEQSIALDAMLVRASLANLQRRDTLLAAALSTASTLVNTVGKHFAQPLRPRNKAGVAKPGTVTAACRDRSLSATEVYGTWLTQYAALPKAVGKPIAIRQNYLDGIDTLGQSVSVLYADPPYTRDHYSRFYHVLETMCLRDNPSYSYIKKQGVSEVSRGLYRADRHQSDFCIRSLAPAAFERLFKKARSYDLPLVLSYSPHETGDGTHPRVVSMDQILTQARKHYDRVEVSFIDGSTHNVLNRNGLRLKTREHAEALVKCFR